MMVQTKQVNSIVKIDMQILDTIRKGFIIFIFILCILWIVIPFGGGSGRMESEVHIVPAGYQGMVYIVFNQNDGYPQEYDNNNSRIYRIPRSGILRTKFKANFGSIDAGNNINFFYNIGDSLVRINKLITEEEIRTNIDSNQVVILDYSYGGTKLNFNLEGKLLSYIVDSLKNFGRRDYLLTRERFENWNK
jgi:hypothetical protein